MAAGLILATVTTTTGETIEQQFWVDDTASPTIFNPVTRVTWGPVTAQNTVDVASGKPMPIQLRGSDGTDVSKELPISIASAKIASGAVASGAIASGAFASGSIASGAFASGSVSSGAIASGAVASGAFASGALASGSIASGAIAAGAIAAGATSIAENEDVGSADGDRGVKILAVRKATPANTSSTDGDYEFLQMANGLLWVQNVGFAATCSTDITRPSDTNVYAANDCWSDSTSAPTTGGFTLTSTARISGGSGIITDIVVLSSNDPATLLQGELWIFDSAVTNVNDNSAFALSDSDAKLLVGVVPFTLATTVAGSGTNSYANVQGLNLGFTCVGTANLRYLVKVKNAYTPASGEVLTVRAKIVQTN